MNDKIKGDLDICVQQRDDLLKLVYGLSATLHFWRAAKLINDPSSMIEVENIRDEYIEKCNIAIAAIENKP